MPGRAANGRSSTRPTGWIPGTPAQAAFLAAWFAITDKLANMKKARKANYLSLEHYSTIK